MNIPYSQLLFEPYSSGNSTVEPLCLEHLSDNFFLLLCNLESQLRTGTIITFQPQCKGNH